jgi:putative ABC transport system ATP-binding protein
MILADEPTGNLDTRSSEEILAIFQSLNRDRGITVVLVTHEPDIGRHTRRVIHVRDGRVHRDETIHEQLDARDVIASLPPPEEDG